MIYLDNNATTKIDPRVLKEMMPFLTDEYGNAASNHEFGVTINQKVKEARAKIANLIGSESNEIIFTSGATEAINLSIKGIAAGLINRGKHILTPTTEHPAVLDTCQYLSSIGYDITYLPVNQNGLIDLDLLEDNIRPDTVLVSVMIVNNETGVIQPIKQISSLVHYKGALFMTDATQAIGKIPINVNDLGIDIMTFSAHKFYGPKGIGGLFARSQKPNKFKINPLIHGGGHEKGIRSGTLNVPGIIGLGSAAEISSKEMTNDIAVIGALRDYLEKELLKIEKSFINGERQNRIYNISSIGFKGVDADALIIGLKGIAVSNGSACSSDSIEPSHVLKAMGKSDNDAFSTIRFSLGRFNTKKEIDIVIRETKKMVSKLRAMAVS